MAQWMAKLSGNEIDLKTLSYLYTAPDCRVARDDDGAYYLTRDAFAAMTEAAAVDRAARECLAIINADMALGNADYEAVSVESIVRENDDGSRSYFVLLSGSISEHGRLGAIGLVTGPDGLPVPSPEPARAQARLKLIEQDQWDHPDQRDQRVKEALDYSQRCSPDDADCYSYAYKISEIVLEDMGGGDIAKGAQAVCDAGWATADEMRDFMATVHLRAFGDRKARHAGAGQAQAKALDRHLKAGAKKLSENEVIACIRRVLRRWLNWKAEQAS